MPPLPDEPQTDLMAKHPDALSPDHAAELERAEKAAEESPAEAEKRERTAELNAHPHTQLRGILSDMRAPVAISGDINTKFAYLHAAVARLVQLTMQHTPPPNDSVEKINEDFERQQQPAEGSHA